MRPRAGRGKAAQFIPIRFVWANKVVGVLASKLVELHQASLQTGGSFLDGVVDTAKLKREFAAPSRSA